MIAFELTMPSIGSWNGKWTGASKRYIRTMPERKVPKKIWGKSFCYAWDDGWSAKVSVERVSCQEAKKLNKISSGFMMYDWMIDSIIRYGEIKIER